LEEKLSKTSGYQESEMSRNALQKENINLSNIPTSNPKSKKKGLKLQITSENQYDNTSNNRSKVSKIENDIEEYLNGQTKSSMKSKKTTNRSKKSRKRSKLKTEMDMSQDQALMPRFNKKKSQRSDNENRLSIFKRFGASKRKSAKTKPRKKTVQIMEEEYMETEGDELNPLVIRGSGKIKLIEELFGSRMNSEIIRANRETMRAMKDHNKYMNTLGSKVHRETMKNRTQIMRNTKKEERMKNCLKKKMEDELKYKIQSHEKMVRDQIVNYVRKM
jgi:hypothetical protein